ncbi:hypothetical protein Desde_3341 [Desulfitobacterium dehalogenans ATCC 51507]|uniref:Uncharacterized protein n=1 Tax=Desulfitobacterium dehalogenans (strain ATCC 51507 / DSM 9161 / JW/IU-DC1) TaxID=756499 RepID=I4ACE4_DESDJ|nr:hypothetical protein [Desulfitobacterium dehalogenans]AFM01629.1 hypothetical protein Desde_3341 [Desulfitobacterium dehalogenans ATCC 51507]
MKAKISILALLFILIFSSPTLAMENLPDDVLNAFEFDVKSFQKQMIEESDVSHHLTASEAMKVSDKGYRVHRINVHKIRKAQTIDLYDALTESNTWHIPVSDRITYIVEKAGGAYKLIGSGVREEKYAIDYVRFEHIASLNGLKDLKYIDEPVLHLSGLIGKTSNGSQFLSFSDNDAYKLEKGQLKDTKELMDEIKLKANEAKTFGFGGSGGLGTQAGPLFLMGSIGLIIGIFLFRRLRFQK